MSGFLIDISREYKERNKLSDDLKEIIEKGIEIKKKKERTEEIEDVSD